MSLLAYLRSRSLVDCDTLNVAIGDLGPFVDCTSNQAIALAECKNPANADLLSSSVGVAKELCRKPPFEIPLPEIIAQVIQVRLSLRFLPLTTGRVHVQVNPFSAQNEDAIVDDAKRIIYLTSILSPETAIERICIKIPSTWAGLRACRRLEKEEDIRTLATTLFTLGQAVAAAEAGCTYVAPYINALKVHFVQGWKDETIERGFEVCKVAQEVYEREGWKTAVLPASLTSIDDVLRLAGAKHITLPPGILRGLAAKDYIPDEVVRSVYDLPTTTERDISSLKGLLDSEDRFIAELNAINGDQGKLVQALDIFGEMQDKLEEIAKQLLLDTDGQL